MTYIVLAVGHATCPRTSPGKPPGERAAVSKYVIRSEQATPGPSRTPAEAHRHRGRPGGSAAPVRHQPAAPAGAPCRRICLANTGSGGGWGWVLLC